ncbi:MAG TPA: DUF2934 domain-containing protein [Verrucomicrobiae bacterium]
MNVSPKTTSTPPTVSCSLDTRGCSPAHVTELIRRRAYQLYEARGRHPGSEWLDWLQAEQELKRHLSLP